MTLSVGTRLGSFEITGELGVGGMGEVYRATDKKLGREVAIKTLTAALAEDAERLARFEREAKLLASLNHAHIASVHNLDEHDGTTYIVMELVQGETLENKLQQGALPVEDALQLGLQIALALEAAHEKRVVHRDLKPANIMITPDGVVKILDFGLAKAFSGSPDEANPLHSPALSAATTRQGLILGTAGYMSPEQASGQATDQRADIWAFGVVLYEMLTGMPVFGGESVPHIIAAVLQLEPDWSRLPKHLHPRLRQMLERCLVKKPRNRLHSIADARIEIEGVLDDPEGVTPAVAGSAAGAGSQRMLTRVAALALTAVAAGAIVWFLRPVPVPDAGRVVRFSIPLPEEQPLTGGQASMIAISPDGARVAYAANDRIYVRDLAEPEARSVPGTEDPSSGAATPAFSPDGQSLVYVRTGGIYDRHVIMRVPIGGGTPVPIHDAGGGPASFPHGLSWPIPDAILFANADGIVRVPAEGGAANLLIPRDADERLYSPQLMPGGETALFTVVPGAAGDLGGFDTGRVVMQSIGGSDRTVVVERGSSPRYLPSGHLVYAQDTSLYAIPFDPVARATRGGAVTVFQNLRPSGIGFTDTANVAVSDTGTLAQIPESAGPLETTLVWVDRKGRELEPLPVPANEYRSVRISPEGNKIVLQVGDPQFDTRPALWLFDRETQTAPSLLTDAPGGGQSPVWSSDSRRVFFRSERDGAAGIYAIDVDTRQTELVAELPPGIVPWTASPGDQTLGLIGPGQADLDVVALSLADGELTPLLDGEANENGPMISPNGAWIAYNEFPRDSDVSVINLRPLPDTSLTRIPVGRGLGAVWSRGGSELLYVDNTNPDEPILTAHTVSYDDRTPRLGPPQSLFSVAVYVWLLAGRRWDADPSGERFLFIRRPPPAENRIDVVLHWFEELKRRVPVD